jgi:solute carrier family 25 uncoupling protein 8/9
MPADGSKGDISFAGRFTASAISACFAEICTIPLDTAKVRLQLQKTVVGDATAPAALPKYRGLLGTAATIAREEGAAALWKGIVPGLHRQCIYGGLRIGLYEPVKSFYVGQDHVGDVPLSKKIAAGFTTGAIAIAVANPTDLVKVRLQAEGKLAPGAPRRYAGAMDAYAKIARQEGFTALWTGLGPNVARNAIINAAELASYDQVKQTILKLPGFKDDAVTHLLSGLGAGFFAVCIGSPVDVVRCPLLPYATVFRKLTLGCHWMSEFRYYFYFPLLLHLGGSHFLGILIFGHGRWLCFQKFPTLLCPEILPTIEN